MAYVSVEEKVTSQFLYQRRKQLKNVKAKVLGSSNFTKKTTRGR